MADMVLFVDDEALILNSLKRGLANEEYKQFFATSGAEALKILAENEICVLVTDMRMPGMSGLDLLKEAKTKYPDLVKIVLSGYTQLPQILVTINQGDIFRFITKPWDLENEFKGIIREAVDFYHYKRELRTGREALEKKNITFQNILKTYDDKLMGVKQEIHLIKDLTALGFSEQKVLIKGFIDKKISNQQFISELDEVENTIMEFAKLVPFVVKRFSTKIIFDELRKQVLARHLDCKLEFSLDNRTPGSLKGKFDLFLFIVSELLIQHLIQFNKEHIDMILSSSSGENDGILLRMVMKSQKTGVLPPSYNEAKLRLLKMIIERLNGELFIKDLQGEFAIIVTMPFQV